MQQVPKQLQFAPRIAQSFLKQLQLIVQVPVGAMIHFVLKQNSPLIQSESAPQITDLLLVPQNPLTQEDPL
jgi:hypothetical protein